MNSVLQLPAPFCNITSKLSFSLEPLLFCSAWIFPFVAGYDGRTALQKAVMVGNLPVVRLLLQYGSDPNLRAQSGESGSCPFCLSFFQDAYQELQTIETMQYKN